jgi:DHA2 family multidrug resistance protein
MCALTQGLVGAFVMSPSVLLPTFLQQLQGYTPAQAGKLMAARGAASMVAMFISGRYASRINGKLSMILGTLLISGTLAMVAQFSVDTPPGLIVVSGILLGIGMPMSYIPTQLIAFATLPEALRTEAGVILRLAVGIGGSIGISLSVAELARSAQVNQAYLGEFFTPYALDRWIAVGGPPGANTATAVLIAEMQRQALSIAYANVYFTLACAAFSSIPVILWMRNTRQATATVTGEQIGHSAG